MISLNLKTPRLIFALANFVRSTFLPPCNLLQSSSSQLLILQPYQTHFVQELLEKNINRMTLYYTMVFGLLLFEMVVFAVLILPLPLSFRRGLLNWFSKSNLVVRLQSVMKILFVLVFILFLDSIKGMTKAEKEHHTERIKDARTDAVIHSKLFYSQRNFYLTGFTLFLSLILNRFYALILELLKNEEKIEAIKKQAENQQKEYLRLTDESMKSTTQIKELTEKLEAAEKKAKNTDIVKKQAEKNHEQYMDLADRFNELEKKCVSFRPPSLTFRGRIWPL
ncbi:B-cell receptor-associated protein 31-like-domain-containing protein [Paraphysoderma sedebokerense]|nr:B-cell receptor-associated protein 31-like-domain-containing protein [Paraphysoderma sedebokerense]